MTLECDNNVSKLAELGRRDSRLGRLFPCPTDHEKALFDRNVAIVTALKHGVPAKIVSFNYRVSVSRIYTIVKLSGCRTRLLAKGRCAI